MKNYVFKILSSSALFGAALALSAAERPTLEALLTRAQGETEAASHQARTESLDSARLAIDQALVLDAKNPWVWYYKGYAAYTEAILQEGKHDAPAQETALNEADRALQKSNELQPSGEALALDASVLGLLIRVRGPESGMQLGPRIGQALEEAKKRAPQSPRVLMIAGVSAMFTPVEWGGDLHRAQKLLEHALAEFEAEKVTAPQPTWGRAEVHVWLGIAHQKLGETAQAKQEFKQVLALDPNYAWVKYSLLPNVEHPTPL